MVHASATFSIPNVKETNGAHDSSVYVGVTRRNPKKPKTGGKTRRMGKFRTVESQYSFSSAYAQSLRLIVVNLSEEVEEVGCLIANYVREGNI